jgi:Protein of unknown function (DUF642)/PEP-CTERM motif
MKVRTLAAVAIFALGLVASARASNLVANGDFANIGSVWFNNTGVGSDDWQTTGATPIPDWSNVSGFANEFWFFGGSNGYDLTQSPGNGSEFAVDLTGQANHHPYGGIEQVIATTIGVTYELTFDLGASTEYNGSGLGPAALYASATGGVVDASQLFTLVPSASNQWQSESLKFTADSSSTTIEFLADSSFTSDYTGLDNVAVSPASTVPEPASLALVSFALVLIGAVAVFWRVRRRSDPVIDQVNR